MAGLVIPAIRVFLATQAFQALVGFLVGQGIPAYLVTRVLAGKRAKQQLQVIQGILDRLAVLPLQATQAFQAIRAFLLIQVFQVIQGAGYQVIVV